MTSKTYPRVMTTTRIKVDIKMKTSVLLIKESLKTLSENTWLSTHRNTVASCTEVSSHEFSFKLSGDVAQSTSLPYFINEKFVRN